MIGDFAEQADCTSTVIKDFLEAMIVYKISVVVGNLKRATNILLMNNVTLISRVLVNHYFSTWRADFRLRSGKPAKN